MASSSDSSAISAGRPRPSPELMKTLWAGKAALRTRRAALPLPEKVRLLLELQRLVLPLIARQRPLRSWEQPWDIEP